VRFYELLQMSGYLRGYVDSLGKTLKSGLAVNVALTYVNIKALFRWSLDKMGLNPVNMGRV
jgi:hypothetical protein